MFEHDPDDPPPVQTWEDVYWGYLNRQAENTLRFLRYWGVIR